jgi:acyl-CoA thioesterase FadM
MNLYLRLIWVVLSSFFRPRIGDVLSPASIRLRVWVNDLDSNGHMNNGRYMTIMDLGRLDLIMRSGILKMMLRRGYQPVLASAQMRFRLQLKPLRPFELQTRILCWDEKWVYMEQRFLFTTGVKSGAVAAIGIVKGGFYDPKAKATVPTSELLRALDLPADSPPFPDHVLKWIEAEETLRALTA